MNESNTLIRESAEWKDYRLECFEEIIISQLHNYFIHRLVNEEDLRKIYRTIAFSDK